jgi:hypothetical protein
MARQRKQYTGEEKLANLRKLLPVGVPVSEICDEHELQPTVFYPQRSGKIERWHTLLETECVRSTTPLSLQGVQRVVQRSVGVYNTEQLQRAIRYIAPQGQAGRT